MFYNDEILVNILGALFSIGRIMMIIRTFPYITWKTMDFIVFLLQITDQSHVFDAE